MTFLKLRSWVWLPNPQTRRSRHRRVLMFLASRTLTLFRITKCSPAMFENPAEGYGLCRTPAMSKTEREMTVCDVAYDSVPSCGEASDEVLLF